ncbi:MAG: 4Fe-4S ferredoxin [Planctomycetota bacterium]|nr:MAG: 4Fe-4S ferredoxin [Planctomycetota bacterium]
MKTKGITKENFEKLFAALASKGFRVVAPVKVHDLVTFQEVKDASGVWLEEINTKKSIKEFFFPATECILRYRWSEDGTMVRDVAPSAPETVIIGARPCDASSLPVMDALFTWDYNDAFYLRRRRNTTVVSIACNRADEYCFCTSVGGGPHNLSGSDVMLSATDSGYLVEVVTEKGEEMLAAAPELFSDSAGKPKPYADVPAKFDLEKVKPWLEKNFDSPLWEEISYKCLQCGVCTYLCPTCHCFDIQDEAHRTGGIRVKNWDGCQFALFTKHTSGHNPRPTQAARWRQRVQHKFNYYVERFGTVSCVGCGRCIRHCPVDMNITDHLRRIAEAK